MKCFAGAAVAFAATLPLLALQSPTDGRLALSGGRIYSSPDAIPIYDGVVLVDAGRITTVGPRAKIVVPDGVKTIDCKGLAIVAGFQNSHAHFTEPRFEGAASQQRDQLAGHLKAMLTQWGVTTVVDTGSELANTLAVRRRVESGEIAGPRILTAGSPLYPVAGVPYYLRDLPPRLLAMLPQPRDPADAAAVVQRQLQQGADLVKLFTGSWVERGKVKPMDREIATAAVAETHRARKLVFSHASNVAGLDVATRSGVDVIAHALDDTRGLTPAHLEEMKRRNMAMIPTLALFRGDPDVIDEVRTFARLGGDILFGTDIGYLPPFNPAEEYRLMAAAGLGWREILASLTTAPARRFGEAATRGTVAPGMVADLVVLAADPKVDVLDADALARVRYTIRAGQIIYAATDANADEVTELKNMQQRIVQALLAHKRDDYAAMLAPEWRVTGMDGSVMTKAQVLEMLFAPPESLILEASEDDLDVRIVGAGMAVVTGRSTFKARDGTRIVLRFTDVAVKRDGRWLIVASHATALTP
jgi:imidazolonepropionase-like amidohydrolase